jgi:hypothetical protein
VPKKPWRAYIRSIQDQYFLLLLFELGITPCSAAGLVPLPGEVPLAHHGMGFLDELPEFRRHVLEVLRQPLEESLIYIISRAS